MVLVVCEPAEEIGDVLSEGGNVGAFDLEERLAIKNGAEVLRGIRGYEIGNLESQYN